MGGSGTGRCRCGCGAEVVARASRAASVSRLTAATNAVRCERLWTRTRVLPSRAAVQEATALLTRVCNRFAIRTGLAPGEAFPGDQNRSDVFAARKLLGLPPVPWLSEPEKLGSRRSFGLGAFT